LVWESQDLVDGDVVHKVESLFKLEIILGDLPFVALVESNELIIVDQVGFVEMVLLIGTRKLEVSLLLRLEIYGVDFSITTN
jgi:hypothetical protein